MKTIHFSQVIYNEQNHYNTDTGLFSCVIPGVYQFSFMCITIIKSGNVELWRNNTLVLNGFRWYQGGRYLSSGDTVLWLNAGDTVSLQISDGTTVLGSTSFFTGRMLFPA